MTICPQCQTIAHRQVIEDSMKAGTTPDDGTRDKINFHLDELREQGYAYDSDTRQMVKQCDTCKATDAALLETPPDES